MRRKVKTVPLNIKLTYHKEKTELKMNNHNLVLIAVALQVYALAYLTLFVQMFTALNINYFFPLSYLIMFCSLVFYLLLERSHVPRTLLMGIASFGIILFLVSFFSEKFIAFIFDFSLLACVSVAPLFAHKKSAKETNLQQVLQDSFMLTLLIFFFAVLWERFTQEEIINEILTLTIVAILGVLTQFFPNTPPTKQNSPFEKIGTLTLLAVLSLATAFGLYIASANFGFTAYILALFGGLGIFFAGLSFYTEKEVSPHEN